MVQGAGITEWPLIWGQLLLRTIFLARHLVACLHPPLPCKAQTRALRPSLVFVRPLQEVPSEAEPPHPPFLWLYTEVSEKIVRPKLRPTSQAVE